MKTKRNGVPTQRDVARRLGLDVSTVNKILRNAGGPTFNKDTVRLVWETAESIGYDFQRLRHQHRRGDERRFGSRPVAISIYRQDGNLIDNGKGVLVEISRSGARLDRVRLPKESLPFEGAIGIRLDNGRPAELRGGLARVFATRRGRGIAILFRKRISISFLDALHGFQA